MSSNVLKGAVIVMRMPLILIVWFFVGGCSEYTTYEDLSHEEQYQFYIGKKSVLVSDCVLVKDKRYDEGVDLFLFEKESYEHQGEVYLQAIKGTTLIIEKVNKEVTHTIYTIPLIYAYGVIEIGGQKLRFKCGLSNSNDDLLWLVS